MSNRVKLMREELDNFKKLSENYLMLIERSKPDFETISNVSKNSEESNPRRSNIDIETPPQNYAEFEKMMSEFGEFKSDGGELKEGGGLFMLGLGSVLSFGKIVEYVGQMFRFLVNKAKKFGIIRGEKWDTTKFEDWGQMIHKYLIKIVFKPMALVICNSTQPFIHIIESFINQGPLENHCSDDDIEYISNAMFYLTITAVLGLSMGPLAGTLATLLIGKVKVLGFLKIVTSGIKFWEIKNYLLAHKLKSLPKFRDTPLHDLAHITADCLEEVGVKLQYYFDIDKFQSGKIGECLVTKLESHH
jgi:hypothetical protein